MIDPRSPWHPHPAMRQLFRAASLVVSVWLTACALDDQQDAGSDTDLPEGLACEDGDAAQFSATITVPPLDPPASEEAGQDLRAATCLVDGVSEAGSQTSVELSCDEAGGLDGQPYQIELTTPGDAPFVIAPGAEVELAYERWWGFEVGSGMRLSLHVGGELVLLVFSEGASQVGDCTDAENDRRIATQQWLTQLDGELLASTCEPAHSYAASFGADLQLFPGQVGELDSGLRFVLESSRCTAPSEFSYGEWAARFAAWKA